MKKYSSAYANPRAPEGSQMDGGAEHSAGEVEKQPGLVLQKPTAAISLTFRLWSNITVLLWAILLLIT